MLKMFELCPKFIYHWGENELRMTGDYYRLKNYITLLLLIVVFFGSCSYRNSSQILRYPKSFNTDTLKTIAVNNPKNTYPEYKIRAFDLISVRNLQDPELLGSRVGEIGTLKYNYKVSSDGFIILPVIGTIKVIGLNQDEAKSKIQELYAQSLFKDPIIELSINSLEVTLLGAFRAEGNLQIDNDNTDLIDILGKSGGLSDDANIKKIRIIRGDRKNPELIVVNLSNINSLSDPKLKLQDGDIIIAEKTNFSSFLKNATAFNIFSSVGLLFLNTYIILRSLK